MGITPTPARLTVTTVLAGSPVVCSSVPDRGSAAASADVVLGPGSTVVVVALTVVALTVVDPLVAAQAAASVAERFTAVAASMEAVVTAADIGNLGPQPNRG
jgi:hypothetical protein